MINKIIVAASAVGLLASVGVASAQTADNGMRPAWQAPNAGPYYNQNYWHDVGPNGSARLGPPPGAVLFDYAGNGWRSPYAPYGNYYYNDDYWRAVGE
jgi:hypothetical protein